MSSTSPVVVLNSCKHEEVLSSSLASHNPEISVEIRDVQEHHRSQSLPPFGPHGDETVFDLLWGHGHGDGRLSCLEGEENDT